MRGSNFLLLFTQIPSFPRRREPRLATSSLVVSGVPAFAGMTSLGIVWFRELANLTKCEKKFTQLFIL